MVDKFHITEKTQEKLMLKLKNSLTKAERNGLISSPLISLILGVLTIIAILNIGPFNWSRIFSWLGGIILVVILFVFFVFFGFFFLMSLSVWNRVSTEVIFDLTSKQITKITTHKIGRKEQTEFDLEKVSRIFVKDGKRNYLELESLGGETFIVAWGEVDDLDELVSTIEEFLNKPSN